MIAHSLGYTAKQRARFTGEVYRQSLGECCGQAPGSPPIPAASGDQRVLENAVFFELINPGNFYAYPGMLAAAGPTTSGLTLTLGYPELARTFLYQLLPVCKSDDYIEWGIPGLRVAGIDRNALRLSWLPGSASLTVKGASGATWRRALRTADALQRTDGQLPCWSEPALHPTETTRMQWLQPRPQDGADPGWLGSGLLRRIGLFNAAGFYAGNGWHALSLPRGDSWVFDLYYALGLQRRDDEFVDALCDPWLGLGLAEDREEAETPNGRHYRRYLYATGGRRGSVQLRFNTDSGDAAWGSRILMAETGAPSTRLDYIVPPQLATDSEPEMVGMLREIHRSSLALID